MKKVQEKKQFRIEVTYFKTNGTYYTSYEFNREFRWSMGDVSALVNMNDVVAYIRGLRQSGGQGSMPGLDSQSSGWDGFILLDSPHGYPCLILPPKEKNDAEEGK